MIIPSIDLMNGKIVKLERGEKKKIQFKENPLKIAKKFARCKEVQVIDLDAAMEKGSNLILVKKICKIVNARVGGGIRNIGRAKDLINSGAKKLIIGTRADIKFLRELNKEIGKEKIIVALDTKEGKVVTRGWKQKTKMDPFQLAKKLERFCSEFLYTYVDKEGLMKGTDFKTIEKLRKITTNRLTVAGGIKSEKEVEKLKKMGIDAVIGMALYTKKIKLRAEDMKIDTEKILKELNLNFSKCDGLIPVITQDFKTGEVLIQAFMNKTALEKTLEEGKVTYYSRSRKKLWTKGETSGNFQLVKEVLVDCDNDSLLIKVDQIGDACHTGHKSCFYRRLERNKLIESE